MDQELWRRVETLFHAARERPPDARPAFVEEACGPDLELRREVLRLLARGDQADGFLENAGFDASALVEMLLGAGAAAVQPAGRGVDGGGPGVTWPVPDDGRMLERGQHIGPYEIQSVIGAGGMGEVYKAHDTRLGRTVAIKVLPPGLAFDAERRGRFEQEARAVSALNHPNICTLFDVGSACVEHDGRLVNVDYLVMEFIDGETLAERLRRGPLPLAQALECGAQVADALSRAHRQGIVHRDLKPANIMLTGAGVKLLDFGLAKLQGAAATTAPMREPRTTPGSVLGTVPYMAPEQLEGKEADARTDVFAFGCVLFEMLTGRRAFVGDSEASVISAIMSSHPPPVSSLQPVTPPLLDRIVLTCLEKEPDRRWQSASDITLGLRWIAELQRPDSIAVRRDPGGQPGSLLRLAARTTLLVALAILLVAGGSMATWVVTHRGRMPVHALIDARPAEGLSVARRVVRTMGINRPNRPAVALSPDGTWLVFTGIEGEREQLYRRRLSDDAATPLAGTEGAESPFISGDGRWIGFWSNGAIWKAPVDGGAPTQICAASEIDGASWSSHDVIAFAAVALYTVPASGGAPKVLAHPDTRREETALRFPHFLPDGETLLVTVVRNQVDLRTASVVSVSLRGGARTPVLDGVMDARYVTTGHLVYARLGSLEAAPFDARRVAITGPRVGLVSDLMQAANTNSPAFDTGSAQFSVSSSGTLLYVPGGVVPDRRASLVWVDRRGSIVETVPLPPDLYMQPRVSPDGRKLLYKIAGAATGAMWVFDVAERTPTLVPSGRDNPFLPIWMPDGRRVAFAAPWGSFGRLWSVSIDGRTPASRFEGDVPATASEWPGCWTRDGRTLVYVRFSQDNLASIWQLRLDGDVPARSQLLPAPTGPAARRPIEYNLPALSPDGHWLAYVSTESGRSQVHLERFPQLGDRQQPSRGPQSFAPAWRQDGRELFFIGEVPTSALPQTMMAIDVGPDGRLAADPHVLFSIPADLLTAVASLAPYDVSSDGQRFIFVRRETATPPRPSQMHVVFNWFEELKAKVPPP